MFLQDVIDHLKKHDTNNLFITDLNVQFYNTINSIPNVDDPKVVYSSLSSFFEYYITNASKDDIMYFEACKLFKVLHDYFKNTFNAESSLASRQPFSPNLDSLLNTDISKGQNTQINPMNQEIVVDEDSAGERYITDADFQANYVKDTKSVSFFKMRDELPTTKSKDTNGEILKIYMESLRTFVNDVDDEILHKHYYYLMTNGKWK